MAHTDTRYSIQNKLYTIGLYKIVGILSKLSETFEEYERVPDIRTPTISVTFSPILQTFVQHLFLLTPKVVVEILEDYKKYDMHKEVIPLIESAWKIGFPMYTYKEIHFKALPQDIKDLQNLRLAIKYESREKTSMLVKKSGRLLNLYPLYPHENTNNYCVSILLAKTSGFTCAN